jgi:heme/copper-type cytochrome/quinol oxidase subunit 2
MALLSAPTILAIDCSSSTLTTQQAIQCGTNSAAGNSGNQNASSSIDTTIANIINILSVVVGVVAVIMIIVAGFRYITSGGKQESITAAKNTLLYAIIGLVIVATAQIIARAVLHLATKS